MGCPGTLWMAKWHTHTNATKLCPANGYHHMPFFSWALGSYRQELSGQANRQPAKQITQLTMITSCALGQSGVEAGGVKETEEPPA